MSVRSSITNSLVSILNDDLIGLDPYTNDIQCGAESKLKFWDEILEFPYISVVPGSETREYLPAAFKWGFLNITMRIYVSDGEDPAAALESLLEDIERLLDANREIPYTSANGTESTTQDLQITSIVTDEGLLDPLGVAELSLEVQYQVL